MKAVLFTSILLFFGFGQSDKRQVKKTIKKMFSLTVQMQAEKLADYIVYRGDDKTRKWKDQCNYQNAQEKIHVNGLYEKFLHEYLPYNYEFMNYSTQKESEGEWLIWEMKFDKENQQDQKIFFAFLKVNGQYLLGDIDTRN